MSAQDLTPTIGTAAGQPVQMMVDGQSATQRPIADLIAANNYLAAAAAARQGKTRGLRFTKLHAPKQVPVHGPASGDCEFGFGGF